jgi:hypothetical protein
MTWRSIFAAAALLAAISLSGSAFAGANDYVFEPVKAEVKKGDDVVVSVRLKHKPGVYSFKTDLSMQGRWLLSIAAKVQGEPETVVGKITFRATR